MKVLRTIFLLSFFLLPSVGHADELRSITFPVQGNYSFSDSYGDPRSGGRVHEGIDIIATKMTPLIAAVDGYVSSLPQDEPSWGYAIHIKDSDGYSYRYLHVNNDTPGTDDGQGGTLYAYAPTISRGSPVAAGQLIGWVGDSGNAEDVGAHLHFEIHAPGSGPINPYPSLVAARHPGTFDPAIAQASAPTINDDKQLTVGSNLVCVTDTLIKGSLSAVYYCGADGKRYVFPNQQTYRTWYADFKTVVTITDEQLAQIPLGGNVTYRPGTRMIKIESSSRVYAVDRGGVLRYVTTPAIGQSMYGAKWANFVDDISEGFFVNYTIGEPITAELPS